MIDAPPPPWPTPEAPAICPGCSKPFTPEYSESDRTWRFPEHPSAIYDFLDEKGRRPTVDGRMVVQTPGYKCTESKRIVTPYDYQRAERLGAA